MSNIYETILGIMRKIDYIGKDSRNVQQNFNFRGIDDVYNQLQPLMAEAGLFMVPEVLDVKREERTNQKGTVLAFVTVKVKYTLYASDGSFIVGSSAGEGMDSGDKATSKAMSIAQKYFVFQTFMPPTLPGVIADPDQESHVITQQAPVKEEKLAVIMPTQKQIEDTVAEIGKKPSVADVRGYWTSVIVANGWNKNEQLKTKFTKACSDRIKALEATKQAASDSDDAG